MSTQEREIAIIIEYKVAPENRDLFLKLLHENCSDTLRDDGCFRMEVSEPIGGDGQTIFLTERWRDQTAIDVHRSKPGHDESHVRVDQLLAQKRVSKCSVVSG